MRFKIKWQRYLSYLAAVFLSLQFGVAQEPDTGLEPGQDTEPPLVEIPETVVPWQPESFPANSIGEDTLLTPSRGETAAAENATAVTVIRADQIERSGQSSVLEVLRGTPGLDVVQAGGPGRQTSVFLRGANSEHTKVLLDGIPLNDPSGPNRGFDFSTLSLDNVERIEVVRGPQSLFYGSDAIGGVINIITRRGEGPLRTRVSAMGGSFGTHQERVHVSGGTAKTHYSFGASYFDTDGISAISSRFGATERDGYQNTTLSGRYGWTPSEAFNVDYVFRYIDADSEIDGFLVDDLFRENRLEQFFQNIEIQSALCDGSISQKVGFSLTDYNRLDTNPGFFGTAEFAGQSRQVYWQNNLLMTEHNTLTAGIDYLHEEALSTSRPLESQHLTGVYLQDRFSLADRFFTTAGVRWDEHSIAGDAQTYRVTQLVRWDETRTRLHGSIGRGFKAPAIAQRSVNFFGGNPLLRPEFSKGWDAGVEQELLQGCLVADVTYFRNDFDDLIVFDPTLTDPLNPFGKLNNVLNARSSGVEMSASVDVTCCTAVTATYSFTDTVDLNAHRPLLRRPRNKAGLNIGHRCCDDQATVNLYLLYVGRRRDFGTVGFVDLGDYVVVNLSTTYQLADHWQAFGRIDNLTDTDYEETFGFATPGVSGYAGMNLIW